MAGKEVKPVIEKEKLIKAKQERPKSTADLLLDNFVSLQRIMTDLAIRISRMNNQLSKFLELFDEAARSFKESKEAEYKAERRIKGVAGPDDELARKIDRVIEQNRDIARGLNLMGQVGRTKELTEESEEEEVPEKPKSAKAKPLPEYRF